MASRLLAIALLCCAPALAQFEPKTATFDELQGTWSVAVPAGGPASRPFLRLKTDGSCSVDVSGSVSGTYSLSGDRLIVEPVMGLPVIWGAVLNGDSLTLDFLDDGSRCEFRRAVTPSPNASDPLNGTWKSTACTVSGSDSPHITARALGSNASYTFNSNHRVYGQYNLTGEGRYSVNGDQVAFDCGLPELALPKSVTFAQDRYNNSMLLDAEKHPAFSRMPGGVIGGVVGGIASAAPVAAAAGPPPQRVRVSQGVLEGNLLHKVSPEYPPIARQARISGSVVLQTTIGKDGSIQDLHVVSGHPLLVQAALDAVRQWRYRPYVLNGQPVEADTIVTVNFNLAGDQAPSTASSQPSDSQGVYRVGGSVTPPQAIYNPQPQYSEEARRAKMQGNVTVSCVVGADGLVHDAKVVRPAGYGMDENALEAVRQWRFEPAKKDGQPVPVQVNIEVSFRLQ